MSNLSLFGWEDIVFIQKERALGLKLTFSRIYFKISFIKIILYAHIRIHMHRTYFPKIPWVTVVL